MASLSLKHIYKVYSGGVRAVSDFNLEIDDKEFIVFVGPSGCGKSTTLRMIAGLEEISSGELYIDGRLVNDVEPKDRDIAMVFQNYALYPHMTVYDNMAFGLKLRKTPRAEIHERVLAAAEILGITDLLDRQPKAMSGGQRQRVAIGRAIVRNPQVFLMDEPLSNLDAKLRNQMRSEILLLRKRIDTTFIYVTHDQTEAMTLGDRIVIMKDGLILQVGTPQQLFDEPNSVFVAGFIGAPQMNMMPGVLEKKGKSYSLTVGEHDVVVGSKVSALLADNNAEPGEIIVGVRPEHISVSTEATKGSLPATVHVTEMMGSEIYAHLQTASGDMVVVCIPTFGMDPAVRSALGQYGTTLYYTPSADALHMFDKQTEYSILYTDSIIAPESEEVELYKEDAAE